MVKPLAKRQSIQELTQQLSEAYAALLLQKEFFELKGSIQEYKDIKPSWLEGFLKNSPSLMAMVMRGIFW